MPPFRPSDHAIFAGINVAIATTSCALCAIAGRPEMILPVCGMVSCVYGIPRGVELIAKVFLSQRNE
jgi:hypothetical protein